MKRRIPWWALLLPAMAGLLVATLAEGANHAGNPTAEAAKRNVKGVACLHYPNAQVTFKKKPNRCLFMEKGGEYSYQGTPTKSLKWKRWGYPHAKGKGVALGNSGFRTPVKILLSKWRNHCGKLVYSKIKVKFPELGTRRSYRLDTCRR